MFSGRSQDEAAGREAEEKQEEEEEEEEDEDNPSCALYPQLNPSALYAQTLASVRKLHPNPGAGGAHFVAPVMSQLRSGSTLPQRNPPPPGAPYQTGQIPYQPDCCSTPPRRDLLTRRAPERKGKRSDLIA